MKKSKIKNILVCVTGLTPQIVTETLWCLAVKQKIRIDELYLLTTSKGKEIILKGNKIPGKEFRPMEDEMREMCKAWKIQYPLFTEKMILVAAEESVEKSDIRSDADNKLFPTLTAGFIREKSYEQGTVLYCSVSGGRKTMGIHLSFALSLFGRTEDRLLHVLTSEANEFKGFYPKTVEEGKQLELAELPFISLRPAVTKLEARSDYEKLRYLDIVDLTRQELQSSLDPRQLELDLKNKIIRFGKNNEKVEPKLLAFYLTFLIFKKKGKRELPIGVVTETEFFEIFKQSRKRMDAYHDTDTWKLNEFTAARFGNLRTRINKSLKNLIPPDLVDLFIIDSSRGYGDSTYLINADLDKFKITG